MLADAETGKTLNNHSSVKLEFSVYSSENPPTEIKLTTLGNQIIKGEKYEFLQKGEAKFRKMQVKEVSSHFRNGWIFLVVTAVTESSNVKKGKGSAIEIDPKDIKPLIFDKIVVKAKLRRQKTPKRVKVQKPKTESEEIYLANEIQAFSPRRENCLITN